MASFTDNITQFTPYVAEVPTEALLNVGMAKQQQFDTGVQRIQGQIDSIAALPIAKDDVKNYLTTKLGQLKSAISTSIAGDYSDMRLQNQIGGLTKQIGNDPIIENGVASTMAYQAAQNDIKEARKSGKYAPQNEWDVMSKAQSWLNDGDVTSSFNASYSPYTDVMKEFYEAFKIAHPSSRLTQDAFRIGKSGKVEINPAMLEHEEEGVTPDVVSSIANTVFSRPEIQNQIRIDGNYSYRGDTPDSLYSKINDSYNTTIKGINSNITDLQLQLQLSKTTDKTLTTQKIEQLKRQGDALTSKYRAMTSVYQNNPEGLKGAYYENNLTSDLINSFSWSSTKDKYVESPFFSAQMQTLNYELSKAKYSLDVAEFGYRQAHDAEQLGWEKSKFAMEQMTKAGKDKTSAEEMQTSVGNVADVAGKLSSSSFYDVRNQKNEELSQAMLEGVFGIANGMDNYTNPIKYSNGQYNYNVDPTGATGYRSMKDAQDEFKRIYGQSRAGIMNGSAKGEVVNAFRKIDPLIRTVRNMDATAKKFETPYKEQLNKFYDQMTSSGIPKVVTNIKGIDVTRDDLVDMYIAKNAPKDIAGSANKRLTNKFGKLITDTDKKDFADISGAVLNNISKTSNAYGKVKEMLDKSNDFPVLIDNREKAFRDAQVAFLPLNSAFLSSKPEDKETMRQRFLNVYNAKTKDNEADKEDLGEWLASDDKVAPKNAYGFTYDRGTGEYNLTVSRGKEVRNFKVSEQDINAIPGTVQINQFWRTFGDDLSLTQNTTTDVTGTGEPSAYIMPRPRGSKYDVRYHVTGNGQGTYGLKMYVRDNKTGKLILGPADPGIKTDMSGLMGALSSLQNDLLIDGLLQQK